MLESTSETLSSMPLSDHEEQTWLIQQQHPERLPPHFVAWQLSQEVGLNCLSEAIAKLVDAHPNLNCRYRFSEDGELHKLHIADWHACLEVIASPFEDPSSQLPGLRPRTWAADTQPPFKAWLISGAGTPVLALALHPILDDLHQLDALLNDIRQHYRKISETYANHDRHELQLRPLPDVAVTEQRRNKEEVSQTSPSRQEAGRDSLASLILSEFRSVLGEGNMTVYDDFFDFGGHSLLATRIIGRLRSLHGIEVRFSDFFKSPTAAALAERSHINHHPAQAANGLQRQDIQQAPMALAQASLWRACEAFGFGSIFNLPFALEFSASVDENVLRQAFTDLLERHSSLRTHYFGKGEAARQTVVPMTQLARYPWFWSSHESQGITLADEASHAFNLAQELPIRIRFLPKAKADRQVLSFLVHHMAVDEWSLNTMMRDLAHAYLARSKDEAPAWPAAAGSFHDFSERQHRQGINPQHLGYWVKHLHGAEHRLQLPDPDAASCGVGKPTSSKAQCVQIKLAEGVLEALQFFARGHESSLFSVVYAAIALSLHKLGHTKDLVIGTSASGRTDAAFFDTVGYFTTLVAHRVQFDAEHTLGQFLGDLTALINDSMSYADVPMEHVQTALGMSPAEGLPFDVYIQIHANNALNGALMTPEGRRIPYRQLDPIKRESMFGLQFEIMEDIVEGQRTLRLLLTYQVDRYSAVLVEAISDKIKQILDFFIRPDVSRLTLAQIEL